MKNELLQAQARLDAGELVGMPTETVYGLAARIDRPSAIKKIFLTKERPFFDPLIVHVSSIEQAKTLTNNWNKATQILAEIFWPGPLTMVLPKAPIVNEMITSGLPSVGIRMPAHPLAQELITIVGVPLAAPSANKFGRTSPTSAEHVRSEFVGEDIFVIEGGPSQIGIESTVLLIKEDNNKVVFSILRKGHIIRSDIEKVLNEAKISFQYLESPSNKESPGHMKHHYMPPIPLILVNSELVSEDEIIKISKKTLSQMPDIIDEVKIIKPQKEILKITELKLSKSPHIASRELYAQLRKSSEDGADLLYFRVAPIHKTEHWEGILDRLSKAASLTL